MIGFWGSMELSEYYTANIWSAYYKKEADFWQVSTFHRDVSEQLKNSHILNIQIFVTSHFRRTLTRVKEKKVNTEGHFFLVRLLTIKCISWHTMCIKVFHFKHRSCKRLCFSFLRRQSWPTKIKNEAKLYLTHEQFLMHQGCNHHHLHHHHHNRHYHHYYYR